MTGEEISIMISYLSKLFTGFDSIENNRKPPRQRVADALRDLERADNILLRIKDDPDHSKDQFEKLAAAYNRAETRLSNFKSIRKIA
jgi:hypothetical protein